MSVRAAVPVAGGLLSALLLAAPASAQDTVRARVQLRPGAPGRDVAMEVRPVPVDPPTVPAEEAQLREKDLVLGVVVDGEAVAYPVRYLAPFEVVNDRVGSTSLAPTW